MPLWELHCSQGVFTAEDKRHLARAITDLYTGRSGLPASYVGVLFHELPEDCFLVGGQPRSDFVRIVVDHIARSFEQTGEHLGLPDDTDWGELWRRAVTRAVGPTMVAHGLQWELHTDETPRRYWYIDGQIPPPSFSDEERRRAAADASAAAADG